MAFSLTFPLMLAKEGIYDFDPDDAGGETVNAIARRYLPIGPAGGTSRDPIYRILKEHKVRLRSAGDEMRKRHRAGTTAKARAPLSERRVLVALNLLGVEAFPQYRIGKRRADFALAGISWKEIIHV